MTSRGLPWRFLAKKKKGAEQVRGRKGGLPALLREQRLDHPPRIPWLPNVRQHHRAASNRGREKRRSTTTTHAFRRRTYRSESGELGVFDHWLLRLPTWSLEKKTAFFIREGSLICGDEASILLSRRHRQRTVQLTIHTLQCTACFLVDDNQMARPRQTLGLSRRSLLSHRLLIMLILLGTSRSEMDRQAQC